MSWNFPDRLFAGPERFEIFAQAQENRRRLAHKAAYLALFQAKGDIRVGPALSI
jgi:hypothetical protein